MEEKKKETSGKFFLHELKPADIGIMRFVAIQINNSGDLQFQMD